MSHLISLLCSIAFAQSGNLPKKFDIQQVDMGSIPYTKRIHLKTNVTVPEGFHASEFSKLDIYEKEKGGWKHVQSIKPNKFITLMEGKSNKLSFDEILKLNSDSSEVAYDLSVSFCNKVCVINNFQGVAKRNAKTKNRVVFLDLKGQTPKQRLEQKRAEKNQKKG